MFNKKIHVVILLFAGASQMCGDDTVRSDIKGRLLTPEEGCGLSKASNNNRIVGGAPAKNGAWPWLALLGGRAGFYVYFSCGGSLITTRHVLTAAHCFKFGYINFVRIGEYDTDIDDGTHVDVGISHVEQHTNYSKYLIFSINDIAIVHLEHDVQFTDRISPICMPISKNMQSLSFVGSTPFIAGWGNMHENTRMTNILQQVQIPVIENTECKQKYQNYYYSEVLSDIRFNESYVLCAGFTSGGKDACQGDSGGPMMLPINENGRFLFYQIGIVSYGIGCGRPNIPGVYTNVQQQIGWILNRLD